MDKDVLSYVVEKTNELINAGQGGRGNRNIRKGIGSRYHAD